MNLVQAVNPKSHRFYTRANVQKVHLPEDMPSDIQGLSRKELKEKEPVLFNFLYKEDFEPKKREEIERSSLVERIEFFNNLYEVGLKTIKEAEGKDLSIIIGRGRCGKSLYFCWLMGDKIIRDPFDLDSFIAEGQSSSNVGPNRGQRSATILPVIKSLGREGLLLVDTPGIEDSRANEVLLVNTLLQQRLLSFAKTTSITILVSYNILNEDYIRWANFLKESRDRYGITQSDQEHGNAPVRIVVLRQGDRQKARMKLRNEGLGDPIDPLGGKIGFPDNIYDPLDPSERGTHINEILDLAKWKIQPTIVLTDSEKAYCSDLFQKIEKDLLIKTNSPGDEKKTLKQASDQTRIYIEVLDKIRSAAGEGVENSYMAAKQAHKNYLKEVGAQEFQEKSFEKISKAFTENKETLENCECIENNRLAYESGFSLLYTPASKREAAIASLIIGALGGILAISVGGMSVGAASLVWVGVSLFSDYSQLDQAIVNRVRDFYKYSMNRPQYDTPVGKVLYGIKAYAQEPVYKNFEEKKAVLFDRIKDLIGYLNKFLIRLETLQKETNGTDKSTKETHQQLEKEKKEIEDIFRLAKILYNRIEDSNHTIEGEEDLLYKYLIRRRVLTEKEIFECQFEHETLNLAKKWIEGNLITYTATFINSIGSQRVKIQGKDFVQNKEVRDLDHLLAKGEADLREKEKGLISSLNDLNISYEQLREFQRLEQECKMKRYYPDTAISRAYSNFQISRFIS